MAALFKKGRGGWGGGIVILLCSQGTPAKLKHILIS